jgi:serine/threonine protein phosphatase 1
LRLFAISDIHGCLKTFEALLNQIGLNKDDQLYLLGDYIDRGPNSKGVLDKIIALQAEGYQVRCLRGNHEQMMLSARSDMNMYRAWKMNGGDTCMSSFGAESLYDIPKPYFDFMTDCFHHFQKEDFLFVHAGLNLNSPAPLSDKKSLLWIRKWEEKGDLSKLRGQKVIHGHTPQRRIDIELRFEAFAAGEHPVLNIDCGCAYPKADYHQLCAVDLINMKLFFQKNIE